MRSFLIWPGFSRRIDARTGLRGLSFSIADLLLFFPFGQTNPERFW